MKIFIIFYTLICCIPLQAQHLEVRGYVLGETGDGSRQALSGATVWLHEANTGTLTDEMGAFNLQVEVDLPTWVSVSYVGLLSDSIEITDSNMPYEIVLKAQVELDALVIEGEKSATSIATLGSVNKITLNQKELMKAACCNLSESFETNLAVDAEFSDAVTGARTIRLLGLDGVYAQINANGIPAVRGLASSYGLLYIPGSWIESIAITKGPGSVEQGYEGISGVVNADLVSPGPQETAPLFLNLYGNNNGRLEANAIAATPVGKNWYTGLLWHGMTNTREIDHNLDGFLDMPLGNTMSVMNNWVFNNSERVESRFGVKATWQNSLGGQPGPMPDSIAPLGTQRYVAFVQGNRTEAYWKYGYLGHKPGARLGFLVSGIHHRQDALYGEAVYEGEEKYLRAQTSGEVNVFNTNHLIKGGVSYLYNQFTESFLDQPLQRTELVPGVYGEYIFTLKDTWSIMSGYRLDRHNLYGFFHTPRVHLRYSPNTKNTFRASAGKAYRVANVYAENAALLISSRALVIQDNLQPEEAWNAGISYVRTVRVFNRTSTISADFYYTYFLNQVVVNRDTYDTIQYVSNISNAGFTQVAQLDWIVEPFKHFDVKAAYRYTHAISEFNGEALPIPLVYRHRGMLNLAYAWKNAGLMADATLQVFGSSRLPNLSWNHDAHHLPTESPAYVQVLAQVTKQFQSIDLYIGVENATNYTQHMPIIAPNDPFGSNFDASVIYAPIMNRRFYGGLRYTLQNQQ